MGKYEKTARQTLTNDEPEGSPVVEFTEILFELADDFSELESEVASHSFSWGGLRANGLDELETKHQKLIQRLTEVNSTFTNPDKNFRDFSRLSVDVDENDVIRHRTAKHGHADYDQVMRQIRDSHDRVAHQISSKRDHANSIRGLVISSVAAFIAIVSLIATLVSLV